MRPGQIQVFDGLRLTTEHMNHFQGSLHSAIQDLREIMGLGQIHTGFDIIKESNTAVTVMPGLAFDYQKNRVVCDEPKTLEVIFKDGENEIYLCVQYKQIEDCLVEDRPTLIWDPCSILTRPAIPTPQENLIAIAVLVKSENDSFEILPGSEIKTVESQSLEESSDENNADAGIVDEEPAPVAPAVEVDEDEAVRPEISAETEEADEILLEENLSTEESSVENNESESIPEEEAAEAMTEQPTFRIKQGVIHMNSDNGSLSLQTLLNEPLRKKINSAIDDNCPEKLRIKLAEAELPLDFMPATISCNTIINASTNLELIQDSNGSNQGQEETLTEIFFNMVGQGEVTLSENEMTQFGISTVHADAIMAEGSQTYSRSEITESGIAIITFSVKNTLLSNLSEQSIWHLLRNIGIGAALEQAQNAKLVLILSVFWKGEISEEILDIFASRSIHVNWGATVTWKAIGGLSFNHS